MKRPIIDEKFKLQKMDGKGGWTYALLPAIHSKTGLPFGWYIVKGTIDNYQIQQYKLWSTANGKLFMPVKASIRKQIKKEAGDQVHICLFEDRSSVIIPNEFLLCLHESPEANYHFDQMSDTNKKQYIDYIYSAQRTVTKERRIVQSIEKLGKGMKWHEKE